MLRPMMLPITRTGFYQHYRLVLVQSTQRKGFCSTNVLILVYEVISGYKYLLCGC